MVYNRRLKRRASDDGSALAIALVFLMMVGIIITAALNKSGMTAKTGLIVRDQTQVQYAADAGVDRALQVLRSDLDGTPRLCTDAASETTDTAMTNPSTPGVVDSGGFSVDGHVVQYSCRTLIGSTATSGDPKNSNFAIVATGGSATSGLNHAFTVSNGNGKPLLV